MKKENVLILGRNDLIDSAREVKTIADFNV
jgi:hypothetical protein